MSNKYVVEHHVKHYKQKKRALKKLLSQGHKFSKTTVAIRVNLLQSCPSFPSIFCIFCVVYIFFFMFWVVIFIGLLNFVTVPTFWILMSWSSAGFRIVPYWWATLVLNSLLLFLSSPIFLREFLCNFLLFQSLFPRLTKL